MTGQSLIDLITVNSMLVWATIYNILSQYGIAQFGIFVGAIVGSVMGFGGGLVALPVVLWVLPIFLATPLLNAMSLVRSLALSEEVGKGLKHKMIYPLILGNLLGALIGTFLLINIRDNISLVRGVGVWIIFFEILTFPSYQDKRIATEKPVYIPTGGRGEVEIIRPPEYKHSRNNPNFIKEVSLDYFLVNWPRLFKRKNLPHFGIGVLSGALSSVFGIGGPPIMMYLRRVIWEKELTRSTAMAFFLMQDIAVFLIQIYAGLYTPQLISLVLVSIPFSLLGVYFGKKLFPAIDYRRYKILITVIILIGAITLIVKK